MLLLFYSRVDHDICRALQQLVLAMSLPTSYEIGSMELQIIERLLKSFMDWFYDIFYRGEYEQLPVCKYTIHGLFI